jgi:sugar lactone lactonase YvrE
MINTPQRWMSRAFTLFFLNVLVLTLGLSNLWARPAGPKVSLRGVPIINTIAGNGIGGGTGDGAAAAAAELQYPSGVTLDRAGNIYIADSENYAVRVVNTQRTAITVAGISIQPGNIATVAGTLGTSGNSGNGGAATSAQIGWVNGIAVDGNGNIYIADESNSFVRKISSSGVITIVAGNGLCSNGTGQDGDGGPATLATVGCGYGVAVDASGNLFLSDTSAGRIREVNTQGIISTIAGSGSEGDGCGSTGSTGDGGPADQSTLGCPLGVHVDSNGNPYFADYFGQTVRYINLQNVAITVAGITIQPGDIDRIAGNQTPGYSGDGGPAVSAELYYPWDVVIDGAGNAYISDSMNDVIRKVDLNGTITTFAGTFDNPGYSGDGGPADAAAFSQPASLAVDRFSNLYVADSGNSVIRKISGNSGDSVDFGAVALASNIIQAVTLHMRQAVTISNVQSSGDFVAGVTPGIRAHAASSRPRPRTKYLPAALLKLRSNLKPRTDATPAAVAHVEANGCIGTFAPGDICRMDVQFTPTQPGPRWFQLTATDSDQTTYTFGLTGTGVGSLVSITPGFISTPPGGAGVGAATGMVRDDFGNTFVADYQGDVVSKITPQGVVSVVAGIPSAAGYDGDGGLATSAHLNDPIGLTLDSVGNLYIADVFNNVIRKVDTNGIITTVAGQGTAGYSGDGGLATNAELNNPLAVLADTVGNLYIGDTFNNVVRKVDLTGKITTIAGTGAGAGTGSWSLADPNGGSGGDGGPATQAQLNGPNGMALDGNGNLYIADTWNGAVRRVDGTGTISVVAGLCGEGCQSGYTGDGGPATEAELNLPFGLAVDPAGDFYVADTGNRAIRKIDVNGVITTVAGNQQQSDLRAQAIHWYSQAKVEKNGAHSLGSLGDGGLATNATINTPVSVSVDDNGNFYLTDVNVGVRMVNVSTSDMNFGSINPASTSASQTVTVSDAGNATLNFSQISLAANFGWGSEVLCSVEVPLTSGNSCPLVASFAPPAGGNYSGSIILTDDALNSPHSVTMEGVGTQPAYSITANPTTLTLHQGQTGTATLTVTPIFGYTGTIQFACSSLPAYSTCSFLPTSAVFDGNTDPISVTLTVNTTGPAASASVTAPVSRSNQTPGSPLYAWLLPVGLVGVVLLGAGDVRRGRKRPRVLPMLFAFALLTGVMFLNGCATGAQTTTPPPPPPPPPALVTPLGTYSAVVTATATGGSGHTTAITITVVK